MMPINHKLAKFTNQMKVEAHTPSLVWVSFRKCKKLIQTQ